MENMKAQSQGKDLWCSRTQPPSDIDHVRAFQCQSDLG